MSDSSQAIDLALLVARVWIAFMVFMHGWRHLKALRSGPGMANWFESLGLKPGTFHAWNVTLTELVFPVLLVVGLLTPFAYGGVAALMLVAFMTNHRQNGFFLTSAKEGYEYVVTVAVVAIAIATFGAASGRSTMPSTPARSCSSPRRRSPLPRSSGSAGPRHSSRSSGVRRRKRLTPADL